MNPLFGEVEDVKSGILSQRLLNLVYEVRAVAFEQVRSVTPFLAFFAGGLDLDEHDSSRLVIEFALVHFEQLDHRGRSNDFIRQEFVVSPVSAL